MKLKESGVPWLGEVPEHWEVKDLKHIIGPMEQGWSPQCDNYPADESEWGVLKAGCVNGTSLNEMENKRLPDTEEPIPALEIKPGDILMSRANTVDLIGSCGYVDKVRPRLILCDKLYRFHALPGVSNGRYLVHFLRSRAGRSYMEQNTSGASDSMQNIGQDVVRNIVMPCPPLKEQETIVAYIESSTIRIDALITKVEQAVLRLQEYRTALISAAVTGKVRVATNTIV
ncbi:MAG: restriction endonuclease subunit S [Flavobacteriales bacterium]|nr:MAG: restriction endonuclease subunit S [Flavobacteriales bacterium]